MGATGRQGLNNHSTGKSQMDLLHVLWAGFANHFQFEMVFVGMGILMVYGARQTHRVPKILPASSRFSEPQLTARASLQVQGLADLGFKPVGKYDVSMSSSVQMNIDVFLSANQLYVATIVKVRSEAEDFSFVEFHTDLAPHGNITTNNSKHASIFYYPPDKMVVKVPWRKSVMDIFDLHVELCEAAKNHLFNPTPLKPGQIEGLVIKGIRNSFEDQVKCGRMVKVSEDVYRASFKGALIAVPLVWHKKVYGFLYNIYRPSNKTYCTILGRRLQKARLMTEPFGAG
jgi:hypothetical protein